MYCRVAVNYPIKNNGLTYHVPEGICVTVGDIVDVPLGKRKEIGCVLELNVAAPEMEAKDIYAVREDYPRLRAKDIQLFQWMADYYHYGLGQHIADCLPASKKRPRLTKPETYGEAQPEPIPLPAQIKVIDEISRSLGGFHRHLVHGVTGSGKTLVFLHLIRQALQRNQSALYLLPEINLTPQFVETFRQYLNAPVHCFHSEVTASERYLIWKEAAEASIPSLFIGVRSSVFLPINNLGIVIIDEEHDGSFKQEDRCPYNARDVGIKKAQIENCPIVLGSATPAVETWWTYKNGGKGISYHPLPERIGGAILPMLRTVDSRSSKKPEQEIWPMQPETMQLLRDAVERKEQALVFINRLGFANYLQCRACGHQFHCPNCSTTLRFFKQKNILSCQHCEYVERMPESCPKCYCLTLLQKGFGTERVQGVVQKEMPESRIERFDREEIKTFVQLRDKLTRFHNGEIDVLVGTQMLSKGHNFRRVKKVVILGVDNQLCYPDFRANERVWQTVVQVAGRAGRYSQDGEVLIQTANPDSPLFAVMANQGLDDFYQQEIPMREMSECPPFFRLAALYFTAKDQSKLSKELIERIGPILHGVVEQHFPMVRVLGPRPATIEKKSNQYTWTILLKAKEASDLHRCIDSFLLNWRPISWISLKIDVDPQHLG